MALKNVVENTDWLIAHSLFLSFSLSLLESSSSICFWPFCRQARSALFVHRWFGCESNKQYCAILCGRKSDGKGKRGEERRSSSEKEGGAQIECLTGPLARVTEIICAWLHAICRLLMSTEGERYAARESERERMKEREAAQLSSCQTTSLVYAKLRI